MKDFLMANWFVLLFALAFVGYGIFLIITKQWTKLRMQAYGLMLAAERIFADNEGRKKFAAVFEKLYFNLIPPWFRLFVSPDSVKAKLQEWYNIAKDYLDDGNINDSISEKPG
jgi:hypothetical protein